MNYFNAISLAFLIGVSNFQITTTSRYITELDEYSLEKLVTRFRALMVIFDIPAPISYNHFTYEDFASEYVHVNDLLVASVDVHEYIGTRINVEFARRFGVNSDRNLPSVKLFLGNVTQMKNFARPFTKENLREFVEDYAGIYMGREGCLEECDRFARKFATARNKRKIMSEIENFYKTSKLEDKPTIKVYILIMQRIIEHGYGIVTTEITRLGNVILSGNFSMKNGRNLLLRKNIMHSFETR